MTPGEALREEPGSLRVQVIYSGRAGNTISAVYREYVDDLARPAFSQDLQFDAEEGVIAYRSIRIEVIEATNTQIRYRVVDDGGLTWLP